MKKEKDIELKVCKNCDAPLPCENSSLNFYNYDHFICDDCFNLVSQNES